MQFHNWSCSICDAFVHRSIQFEMNPLSSAHTAAHSSSISSSKLTRITFAPSCGRQTIKLFYYKRNWNCEKIWPTWKRMSIACSWSSWVFSSFVSYYSIDLKFIFIQLYFIVSKGLQGGFAFYESACVRPKNVTNVLFRNYIDSSNY
jgi:hypothetical protein